VCVCVCVCIYIYIYIEKIIDFSFEKRKNVLFNLIIELMTEDSFLSISYSQFPGVFQEKIKTENKILKEFVFIRLRCI
jgi:hypothetical protein